MFPRKYNTTFLYNSVATYQAITMHMNSTHNYIYILLNDRNVLLALFQASRQGRSALTNAWNMINWSSDAIDSFESDYINGPLIDVCIPVLVQVYKLKFKIIASGIKIMQQQKSRVQSWVHEE